MFDFRRNYMGKLFRRTGICESVENTGSGKIKIKVNQAISRSEANGDYNLEERTEMETGVMKGDGRV